MKYQCVVCGDEFISYNPTPKYCSRHCKTISQTADVPFEDARQLYESGMTQDEVAEEFETTQKVICGLFKRHHYQCRKKVKRNQTREHNDNWKGEKVGYKAFHRRLDAARGRPKKCEVCETTDETKTYDWANLTGQYDDPNDYKRMCRSCHWKYDGTINNIKHMRKEVPNV